MICATLLVQWFDKRQSGEDKQVEDIPKKKTQYTYEKENGRNKSKGNAEGQWELKPTASKDRRGWSPKQRGK